MLAKTRSNGARLADAPGGDAVGFHDLDHRARAVETGVGARDADGAGVDVGREHAAAQRAGGGDGEDAAAGAEIEDAPTPTPSGQRLAKVIEREQAAARGAVMAGAEGQRRFDLDPDPVDRDAGAVVGAVHDKTARRDRRQAGEALAHPVLRRDAREVQLPGRRGPGGARDHRAHRLAVGRRAKIDRDLPTPAAGVEQAHGDIVSGEVFGEEIGQSARRLFVGFQAGNRGRRGVRINV